jgi:hypothetical protein
VAAVVLVVIVAWIALVSEAGRWPAADLAALRQSARRVRPLAAALKSY